MGPGNWRMARMVDEIPALCTRRRPSTAQSFLVLSHLARRDKVIHPVFCVFSLLIAISIRRSLRDVEVTDVRSDDEDNSDDDDDDDDDDENSKED